MPLHVASSCPKSRYEPALQFQFVLSQFLATMPYAFELEKILERLEDMNGRESEAVALQEIAEMVRALLGLKTDGKHLATWDFAKGPLTQLRKYCYNLYQSFDKERSRVRPLLAQVKNGWFYCLRTHDLICVYNLTSPTAIREIAASRTSCLIALKKCLNYLKSLQECIAPLFLRFRTEENVIYFLWRYHKEFDTVCGEAFTEILLEKMFPRAGIEGVMQFLIDRYTERRFYQLIPSIKENFKSFKSIAVGC